MTNFNPSDPEHLLGEAFYLAAGVHRYQKDKSKVSYMLHPLEVMRLVAPDRDAMIVALLHDAIEDFDGPPMGRAKFVHTLDVTFPRYIVEALEALTHGDDDESYEDYVERVAQNYLARRVKIADLTHNMDPRRLPLRAIEEKDLDRWAKYRRALVRLERED